jgi:hypothetical protein
MSPTRHALRALRRGALALGLLAAAITSAAASPSDGPEVVAVGRIVFIEVNHGYAVVDFPNGRMNVSMDKRELGQYIPGDEIRIDSFGRPLPKRDRGQPPPEPRPAR